MYFKICRAEFKKYCSEILTYYPDQIVSLIVTYIIFFAFFYGFGNSESHSYYIGYLYWYFGSNVISEAAITVSSEKQEGTLEQLLIKPISISGISITRTLVWLLFNLFKVIFLLFLIKVTLNIYLPFNLLVIPVFVITIIGLMGFSLILTALTLRYTKTASFESIISYILLFFTGSLISLDKMPKFIQISSQFFPLTKGISMSRSLLDGHTLVALDWLALAMNSGVYFLLGELLFYFIIKGSKNDGINNRY
ncbi:MAG: ABC transporter permease [Sporolactobacillus sp.]